MTCLDKDYNRNGELRIQTKMENIPVPTSGKLHLKIEFKQKPDFANEIRLSWTV